ncbi:MAG TPA: serine protease [Candidatus Sulfotelmatobacter sp.]|nr:serine protease [Candidatus Sulfotelmatobacter sp.]
MRRLLPAMLLLILAAAVYAQSPDVAVKIHAVLVDKDLNQKPVPHLALALQRSDAPGPAISLKTSLDGRAEISLPPGSYRLTTPEPLEFQGKRYQWEMEVQFEGAEASLELSNDNAKVTSVASAGASPAAEDLSAQFKLLRNSVVTVQTEFGHGTGFLVDPGGLVITNEHVIHKSEYLAVQFDEKRKVAADVLASDSEKDVAILRVNLAAYPDAVIAPLLKAGSEKPAAAEGDRVFTIGNPLNQQKVLTTGVVSRVEPKAIISDININPGNSGGPLFNSSGVVIGVTTYNQQAKRGPGLSGIVRIEEALPLVEEARAKLAQAPMPSAELLPVEPQESYPMDALRGLGPAGKTERAPYVFSAGDFDVVVTTPAFAYRVYLERQRELEKEREKRDKKRGDSSAEITSGEDVKNWEANEHRPKITITVQPQLKVKFWASMASTDRRVRARFKTDFYRLRLLCGGQEITPIRPGKVQFVGAETSSAEVNDTTYVGIYDYLPDAISPDCTQITLEIYADKNSAPTVKTLDARTIQAVWNDFEPYRKSRTATAAATPSIAPTDSPKD